MRAPGVPDLDAETWAIIEELDRRGELGPQYHPFSSSWEFLTTACWTRDEASGQIRQFPRWDYLRHLSDSRGRHRIRAYEKSRRMMITWWLVAEYLYDLMTQANHTNAVASDKLEKSAYLLGPDRMQWVYDLIPPVSDGTANMLQARGMDVGPFRERVWPNKPEVLFTGKQGRGWRQAACERTGSVIMAVASGESQMQQYTFSNILMDEFPRWQWQEESWRNIQPTTLGGGCVDIVCTAELGSFAYDLLYDEVAA